MSLAAERTYLAYIRTGLALVAAGVALAGALPDAGLPTLRRIAGLVLVCLGATVVLHARPRWAAVDRAMRAQAPLPPDRISSLLGPAVACCAVAAAVVVVFG